MGDVPDPEDWGDLSFEGTRRFHLSHTLSLPAAERLAWLEDLIDFAYQAGALPRKERGQEGA
ncbi:MAG TPA: hypothetical protein VFV75_19980 [Candidatus Polarisedimenticolaceae bacterium]|nr:hypothetical protein [Candidatus Polarisedimenticolaceae bacterium]HEX5045185.1 hypothetical protein [Candidatus Polarisedimenticolaceae bacterium]